MAQVRAEGLPSTHEEALGLLSSAGSGQSIWGLFNKLNVQNYGSQKMSPLRGGDTEINGMRKQPLRNSQVG